MSKGQKLLPIKYFFAVLIFASLSTGLHAVPITIGSMTYDADINNQVIVDSQNQRDWLRWDVLKGLTYEQTLIATQSGSYHGWQIANNQDAQLFTNALVPFDRSNSCQPTSNEGCWSDDDPSRSYHQLLGDSHVVGDSYDFVFFESHTANNAGFIRTEKQGAYSRVDKISTFSGITNTNAYANLSTGIGWLLYRDHPVSTVNPNTVIVGEPIFGAGFFFAMTGLFLYRRKIQHSKI